jgi:hypothetical protein
LRGLRLQEEALSAEKLDADGAIGMYSPGIGIARGWRGLAEDFLEVVEREGVVGSGEVVNSTWRRIAFQQGAPK